METHRPHPERHIWEYRWVRDLIVISAALVIAVLAYKVRAVAVPLLIALGLAYVVNPLVTWVSTRWRVPRWATTASLMVAGVLVLLSVLVAVLPQVVKQTASMMRTLRGFVEKHWESLAPFVEQFLASQVNGSAATGGETPVVDAAARTQALQRLLDELGKVDFSAIGRVALQSLGVGASAVGSAISTVGYLGFASAVISVSFFTFSWKFDALAAWPRGLIPITQRQRTLEVLAMMDRSVAAFVRGRLIQAAVMGTNLMVGWWLVGVPYWLVLGLLCAMLNLIPYVASLGMLLAVGLSLVSALSDMPAHAEAAEGARTVAEVISNLPWGAALWPFLVFLAAQMLDNWLIEPLVQGKATNLEPLAVMLSVISGGLLAGLFGMLLAIPVAACIKILAHEVILPRLRQYAQEH